MDKRDAGTAKAPVPMYTKVGWVLAWVVMAVIGTMILHNCATSIIYGRKTEPQQVEAFHQDGLRDGRAGQGPHLQGDGVNNPILRKAYNKGYRDGVDQGPRQESPGSGR